MFTPNRCPFHRVHRSLKPGAACDCISQEVADDIVTPKRAPRGRTITPAVNKKSALSKTFPLTPSSTSARSTAPSTVSTPSGPAATPTPAPVSSRFRIPLLRSFTPEPTQDTAAEQQPQEDFDSDEDIIEPSRHSSPALRAQAGSNTVGPSSHCITRMDDNTTIPPRQPIVFERQPSSTSTVLVPETPFLHAPRLGEAGPSNYHDPSPRHDSAGPEEVAAPAANDIAQHRIDLEIEHLHRSRAQYAQELEESTGLINRLQTRRQIHEFDALHNENRLGQLEAERRAAWDQALQAEYHGRRMKIRLGAIVAALMTMVLAYGCWCVYMSPEMEYIMKRRKEVLRE